MLAAIIDGISYWYRAVAIPVSILDVYDEWANNHQDILPMIFGPVFTLLLSYFIAGFFIK